MSNQLPFRVPMTLREILSFVAAGNDRDEPYALYGNDDETDELLLDALYVIDAPPTDMGDEDVYPDFINQAELSLFYSDEHLRDVVRRAMDQSDGRATAAFLVEALNYYDETDDFLNFPTSNA